MTTTTTIRLALPLREQYAFLTADRIDWGRGLGGPRPAPTPTPAKTTTRRNEMAFEYQGTWITDVSTDETARKPVKSTYYDPIEVAKLQEHLRQVFTECRLRIAALRTGAITASAYAFPLSDDDDNWAVAYEDAMGADGDTPRPWRFEPHTSRHRALFRMRQFITMSERPDSTWIPEEGWGLNYDSATRLRLLSLGTPQKTWRAEADNLRDIAQCLLDPALGVTYEDAEILAGISRDIIDAIGKGEL